MNALLVSHPHYPTKTANTLASLVKGRWIDGKAQTVALFRFACDTRHFYTANLSAVKTEGLLSYRTLSVSQTPPLTIPQSQCRKTRFSAYASSTFIKSNIENDVLHCASSLYTRELKVIVLYQPFQNRTIHRFAPSHLPPSSKVRFCCSVKSSQLWWGLHSVSTIILIGGI